MFQHADQVQTGHFTKEKSGNSQPEYKRHHAQQAEGMKTESILVSKCNAQPEK